MKRYVSIYGRKSSKLNEWFSSSKVMDRHKSMIMDFAIKECHDSTFVRKLNGVLDDILTSYEEDLLNN